VCRPTVRDCSIAITLCQHGLRMLRAKYYCTILFRSRCNNIPLNNLSTFVCVKGLILLPQFWDFVNIITAHIPQFGAFILHAEFEASIRCTMLVSIQTIIVHNNSITSVFNFFQDCLIFSLHKQLQLICDNARNRSYRSISTARGARLKVTKWI